MPRLTLEVALVVRVACDGRDLVTYIHLPDDTASQAPRPYLHPMRALSGEIVSLARPHDARWHRGLSFAIPRVGPHDLWGGPGPAADRGSMDHQHFTEIRERTDHVAFGHELVWHGRSGTGLDAGPALVRERRNLRVAVAAPDAWVLTWESVLTNISGEDLPLAGADGADPGAGGLFWRGPRSFTGGTLLLPDGAVRADAHGRSAAWAGFTGRHDETGAASTVVLVDDEVNPGHPAHWSASAEPYAALGPTPFRDGPLPFGPDETLTFRYAVVVGDGTADVASAADLAALGREALVAAAAPPPPPTLGTFLTRRELRRAAAAAPLVAVAEPVPADEPPAEEPPADELVAEEPTAEESAGVESGPQAEETPMAESAAVGVAPVVAVPMLAQVPFVAQVPLAAPVGETAEEEVAGAGAEPVSEVAESEVEPATASEVLDAVDAEAEAEVEPAEADDELVAPVAEAEAEVEPESESDVEPEPAVEPTPETEAEPEPAREAELTWAPGTDAEPEPDAEPVAEAPPDAEPEIEAVPGEPGTVADEDWAAAVDEVVLPELAGSAPDEGVPADEPQPPVAEESFPEEWLGWSAPEVAESAQEQAPEQSEPEQSEPEPELTEPEAEASEPEPEAVEPQADVAASEPEAAESTLVLPALPPDDEPDEDLPSPFDQVPPPFPEPARWAPPPPPPPPSPFEWTPAAADLSAPAADAAEPDADEAVPEPEAEPMTDEAEPMTDEAEPVTAEAEPMTDEAEPVTAEAEPVTDEAEPVTAEAEPVTAERPAVPAPITPPPPPPTAAPAPARQSAWARASAPPVPPDDAPAGPAPTDTPFVPIFLPAPPPEPDAEGGDEPSDEPDDITGAAGFVPPPPAPVPPQPPLADVEAAAAVDWLGSAPAEEAPVPRPAWAPVQADDDGDRESEPPAWAPAAFEAPADDRGAGYPDEPAPEQVTGSPWTPPPLLDPQQSSPPMPPAPVWRGADEAAHDQPADDQPAPDEPPPFFWAPPPSPFGETDDGPADLSAARPPEPDDDGRRGDDGRRRPWWSRG